MITNVKIFVKEIVHISKQGTILKNISLNLHFTALYAYKTNRKTHNLKI